MKKIIHIILLIIAIFIIYIQHQLVYYSREIYLFGKTYKEINIGNQKINFFKYFQNFYVAYFYMKDNDPIYIRSNDILQKYADHCYQNKQNCLIFPHQQTYADFIRLSSIQYIGSVKAAQNSRYLYSLLDYITNLNVNWDMPYVFGALMIPIHKTMYENIPIEIKQKSRGESVNIGDKFINYNCDPIKTNKIANMGMPIFYKYFTEKNIIPQELLNPCTNFEVLNQVGYNYFHFLGNAEKSVARYKLASFHENVPGIIPSMPQLVLSTLGEHFKSFKFNFLNYLNLVNKEQFATDPQEISIYSGKKLETLNDNTLQLEYYILQLADQEVGENHKCFHQYDCLLNSGHITQIIHQLSEKCFNIPAINLEKIDFQNISDDQMICHILNYALNEKHINFTNGELKYPFKEEPDFIFYRDNDARKDWRVKLNEKNK